MVLGRSEQQWCQETTKLPKNEQVTELWFNADSDKTRRQGLIITGELSNSDLFVILNLNNWNRIIAEVVKMDMCLVQTLLCPITHLRESTTSTLLNWGIDGPVSSTMRRGFRRIRSHFFFNVRIKSQHAAAGGLIEQNKIKGNIFINSECRKTTRCSFSRSLPFVAASFEWQRSRTPQDGMG